MGSGSLRSTAPTPFYFLAPLARASLRTNGTGISISRAERYRGLDDREDHLHAATFRATLAPGGTLTILPRARMPKRSSTEQPRIACRRNTRSHSSSKFEAAQSTEARPKRPMDSPACLAADQFVAKDRSADDADGKTMIAGYHWFGDWGRDTMISLARPHSDAGRPEIARADSANFCPICRRRNAAQCFSRCGPGAGIQHCGCCALVFRGGAPIRGGDE